MMKRWAPLLIALVVALPGLRVGLVLDDWTQRAFVSGQPIERAWWDLFNLVPGEAVEMRELVERGPFPWFTLPEVKLRFFRPLSSALIRFDTLVFKDAVWLAHAHSTLWYLGLVALVAALYRRLVPGVAFAAALLFALDDSHTMPVLWLANRNSVLAVTFAWLGLWAHLRWREDGWRAGAPLSVLAYVVALLAGETAIAAMAYVVAFELLGRTDSWRSRALALLPATSVVAVFAVLYRVLGMGSANSATYYDPGAEPLQFLINAPIRLLADVGGQSSGLPADVWLFLPQLRPLLIGLGVVAVVVWPLAWRRWAPTEPVLRGRLRWLGLGGFFALIPPLATFPATRLMIAPSLGFIAVIGALLLGAWRDAGVRRVLGVGWLGLAFVLQPLTTWFGMPGTFRFISAQTAASVRAVAPKEGERIVIVTTSEFAPVVYGPGALAEFKQPLPRSWFVWSMAPLSHRLKRVSERAFELSTVDGRMVQSVFEQNFRETKTHPMAVGDTVKLDGQVVRVIEVNDGAPTAIRIELLEAPEAFRFVKWNGSIFEPLQLPAIGETMELPRADTLFERDAMGR